MKTLPALMLLSVVLACARAGAEDAPPAAEQPAAVTNQFTLTPIGHVEEREDRTFIRVKPEYHDGLLGLDQWSDIWVFYWFDRNDNPRQRSILQVNPRGNRDNPRTGVFACRAPVRPNLIAMSLCRVVSVKDGAIEIEGIDAFDPTPVIDIKPYAPGIDQPKGATRVPDWTGH